MKARIRRLWASCLLAAGAAALPGGARAQPVAKVTFLPAGSFALPATGPGAMERPQAIAWSPSGQIHVADERGTVAVFEASGSFLRTYGADTLRKVASVAVDEEGRAFVLDSEDKSVLVFDESGEVLHRIGSEGSDAGRLKEPVDMALGPAGLVYVLDKGRKGVQVFSLDGTFLHDILLPPDAQRPMALGVGASGGVYVTDKDLPGAIIRLPGLPDALAVVDAQSPDAGRLPLRGGNLRDPIAVVATRTGTIVAGDADSGILWAVDASGAEPVGSDDRLYGGKGSGRGSFRRLADAALAGTDELLMLDRDEKKVERVRLVLEAARPPEPAQDYPVQIQSVSSDLDPGVFATSPTGRGTAWYAIADAEGRNVRVVEAELADRTGVHGNRIRLPEPIPGRPPHAFGQAVERAGHAALNDTLLVVTEPRKNRFHVFDLRTDQLIGSFGDNYSDDRRLRSPRGVSFFPDGRIAVADHDNGRIAVFSADVATLLGTYPLPKAEGVVVAAEGRMFAWDEDGIVAGEFPLAGGALRLLRPDMAAGGIAALATDGAGNLYALRRETGRVAIADGKMERVLARVGGDAGLGRGDRLSVDLDGNIYATDLERAETLVRRWGVDVPPVPAVATLWGLGVTTLQWESIAGSFITGYRVEGAASADGPWAVVTTARDATARIQEGEHRWLRVGAQTLTGAVGGFSPPAPALHVAAEAAFEGRRWDEARALGREALRLAESGEVRAEAPVVPTLVWHGLVAAHEARDYPDVLAWDKLLVDPVPADQAFDHAFRLADALHEVGDVAAATNQALDAIRMLGPFATGESAERLRVLRQMVFENGGSLGKWDDVARVGEDILRTSGEEPDPAFLQLLVRAHLKTGSPERALEVARSGLEAAASSEARRALTVLAFVAAADLGDLPLALGYADAVSDSVPSSLYAEFGSTITRVKVAGGDLPGARSELLFFLLGQEGDIRALADPAVGRTALLVYGGLVESGDPEGGRRMLDSLLAAMPSELADARDELVRQADSVAAVADTRAKLGEGFVLFRDALFRDALRFFQAADGRTDLDVDQRLIVKEILAATFHSLGRVEDADAVFRKVYEVDPDFVLPDHLAHVEATYSLTLFTEEMLDHFRTVGPIM